MSLQKKIFITGIHSGRDRALSLPVEVLQKDIATDVVIIGAGISGALMAEELGSAGLRVVLLDKRSTGHGSTMATTALLQYEIDQPLIRLIPQIGFEDAVRAWRRSKLCVESLAVRIRMSGIRCGLTLLKSLYLNGSMLGPEQLKHEMEFRNQIGLQTELISKKTLKDEYGLNAMAALRSYHSYAANPFHLARGFLKKEGDGTKGPDLFTRAGGGDEHQPTPGVCSHNLWIHHHRAVCRIGLRWQWHHLEQTGSRNDPQPYHREKRTGRRSLPFCQKVEEWKHVT